MTSPTVDDVAERTGLPRDEVIRCLESAVAAVATRMWGPDRRFEVRFDDDAAVLELHQVLQVVEDVENPATQLPLSRVGELGFEAGDEMLVQIPLRDEDADAARSACADCPELPTFEAVAAGLPCPDDPQWLESVWPTKRRSWRWHEPGELPAFAEALDGLERWLRGVAPPGIVAMIGPATDEALATLHAMGPAAADLAAFYARFGGTCEGFDFLSAAFVTPERGREVAALMMELAGHDPAFGPWAPTWQPFLAWEPEIYAVDLTEGAGSRVLHWNRDTREITIRAPSFAAWVGALVVAAQADVVRWDDGLISEAEYDALQAHVLPNHPQLWTPA